MTHFVYENGKLIGWHLGPLDETLSEGEDIVVEIENKPEQEKFDLGITLTSGRVVRPHFLVFGIDENLNVTEGYDNYLSDRGENFSVDDKCFIADYMIDRWEKYKAHILEGKK